MMALPRSLLCSSILFLALIVPFRIVAQERHSVVWFGVGASLVSSSDALWGKEVAIVEQDVRFSYAPRISMSIDSKLRFPLGDRFLFQTGISMINRSYRYAMRGAGDSFASKLRQPGFQIPVLGVLQVPLSANFRIGLEAGPVLEMNPSDVGSGNESYYALVYMKSKAKASLRAGAVIRTELKSGSSMDIGLYYNRMMGRLGSIYMDYGPQDAPQVVSIRTDLQGHYFAMGFSFWFP